MAAKKAVQRLLREEYGLVVPPADVAIMPDERGCPIVEGPWRGSVEHRPVVSIAHSRDTAVALAALSASSPDWDSTGAPLVGIDVEFLRTRPDDFADVAFSPEEQALLDDLGGDTRKE